MSEPFIAEIKMFGGGFAPRGWAFCDGQLLAISQNSALFSILGTTFGGDGRTTFGLPDLRSRVPVHPGTGPGLSTRRWGEKGGTERVQLSLNQLPSHTHSLRAHNAAGNTMSPQDASLAVDAGGQSATYSSRFPDSTMRSNVTETGRNQFHPIVQPFLAIFFIIALIGIFPSRN